jgi:hypothetical protein
LRLVEPTPCHPDTALHVLINRRTPLRARRSGVVGPTTPPAGRRTAIRP